MTSFLIFLSSFSVVYVVIPFIIGIAFKNRLFDAPSEDRKVHTQDIPNAGGIAIFGGFLFSCLVFIPHLLLPQANFLMAAAMIIFSMGLKDDIDDLTPYKKFIAQFVAALITSVLADIRIGDLHGVLGIHELSYPVSVVLTIFVFVGVVNAFNLIDGVDGLAASLGIVMSLLYAFLFYKVDQLGYAYLSVALAGALIAFLYFNCSPARIFMGDSGSLFLGFMATILSIRIIRADIAEQLTFAPLTITSCTALVAAVLVIPIFDTLRVLTLRLINGRSPFAADRNHLHHRLLLLGLNHSQITFVLTGITLLLMLVVFSLQNIGSTKLIVILALSMLSFNGILSLVIFRRAKRCQVSEA